jgi:hypothetical protein
MKNEKTAEELFDYNIVRRWKEREQAKKLSQLHSKLSEFLNDFKTASSTILARTQPEYEEPMAKYFVSQLGAIELCLMLVRTSSEGIIFSPKGWQKETPRPADPSAN